jgi:nucleotide-binding universal stress UspA family protein
MKIIVLLDFSICSEHALDYAIGLATTGNHKLLLVHSTEPTNTELLYSLVVPIPPEGRRLAELKLKSYCEKIQILEIESEYLVAEKSLPGLIEELTEKQSDCMVVMGSEGASGLKKYTFGSNAVRVMESALCPVLIIPPDAVIGPLKTLAYATDFHDADYYSILSLCALAKPLHAEICIVHFGENTVAETNKMATLAGLIKKNINGQAIKFDVIVQTNLKKDVENYVNQHRPDLLALAARHRYQPEKYMTGGLSRELVFDCKIPVLVYHHRSPGFVL